jgi:glycosyltransferase involved in cell wall biosynthesis
MPVTNPQVSCVIIFFDSEKFLTEAISSVLSQTYGSWELILVDDGSTDASTEIAQRFARQHPTRITYVAHPGHQNLGMSASRNKGIRMAKGKWIALLDSDDVWLPNKLHDQVSVFEKHSNLQMVFGNHLFWRSWRQDEGKEDYHLDPGTILDTVFFPPELLLLYFQPMKAAMPVPSDLMFARDMALKHGGFEDDFTNMYEEHPFLIKVYAHEPVFVSSQCWTKYRQHDESTVAMQGTNANEKLPLLLQWTEEYLRSSGFAGTRVWTAMRKSRFRFRHPFLSRLGRKLRSRGR